MAEASKSKFVAWCKLALAAAVVGLAAVGIVMALGVSWRGIRKADAPASATTSASEGAMCATGVSATRRGHAASAPNVPPPTNTAIAPAPMPRGMVWVPGGEFWMGSAEESFRDAQPWHRVYVDGFWMHTTEGT